MQNIITIYRFSEISFQRFIAESGMFIAIYRSGDVSPQRVFSWREMLVFYISFKRNNYKFFQIPPPFCFGLCKLLMLFKCVCKGNIQWKRSQWVHVITLNTASLKWGFIWSSLQHCERRQASREICRFNIRKRRYFIKQMILLKYCSLRLRMKLVNQDQFSMDAFPFHFFANAGSVFWC